MKKIDWRRRRGAAGELGSGLGRGLKRRSGVLDALEME
jgi:hypothetical protein